MKLEIDIELRQGAFLLSARVASDARTLGLFGPSGSGKTSLLEVLAGWRTPDRGRLAVDGTTWFDAAARVEVPASRRRVGYVPQDLLLFPHWTVEQNLRGGSPRPGPGRDEAALRRAIEVLELEPFLARRPRDLSGGERQRVALARALSSGPSILLLDEPLAALDMALRRRLLSYLARVREAFDVPLVVVSHDPTEILALCEECVRLEAGRVVEHGPARRVLLAAARGAGTFENILRGRVVAGRGTQVELAPGVELAVAEGGLGGGEDVLVALRAEDVLVATGELPGISARNVLAADVTDVRLEGENAWVEVRIAPGVFATALLTPAAVSDLGLSSGRRVRLVVKAQSCRVLARSTAR
ncbi:MAG: ATP-binding cassette domain-containing protein [Planctomycetota bacterium]|nr:ATP-binding cassette domain-containing protein [Planctomycetota bacterium]